jgi:D-glycero-alpha-D-manno-heptose 1-phosphate guanylyltransferase
MQHQQNNQVVTEAIILAGGLGTRLREAVPDLPKCMAPVANRPFLSYVIDALRMQGIERFIFSLGYKWEVIDAYLKEQYPTLLYVNSIETEPLGTGGAIQLALQHCKSENVLIANGDTLFKIDLPKLTNLHLQNSAACTLALKPMQHFDRYGVVEVAEDGLITSFQEKRFYAEGLINGGIYLLQKLLFLHKSLPVKFSFEKDYLEKHVEEIGFYGSISDGYFIDIGIPEDYNRAQKDLAPSTFDIKAIDQNWTLFLDRDGVINNEQPGTYVLNWEQFQFSSGVLQALAILKDKVGPIYIMTNQRGVGRQLMTEADLQQIHQQMLASVEAANGRIDGIYYCLEKDSECFYRKPNPGMAQLAFLDHPQIDQTKCVMIGDKLSDMRFGRAAGAFTVFITTTNPQTPFPHPDIDAQFPSLLTFAQAL